MPSQDPISPGQIKPESCREPQTSSRLQQTNVNLQAPRNGVNGYTGFAPYALSFLQAPALTRTFALLVKSSSPRGKQHQTNLGFTRFQAGTSCATSALSSVLKT